MNERTHYGTTLRDISYTLSLYDITLADGMLEAESIVPALPFSRTDYSLFKYGRRDIAERYAEALAGFLLTHLDGIMLPGESAVVMGTPYKRLPNAARMLAITTERLLRSWGLPTCYAYIYQHRLASGDYGTLSSAERDRRNRIKKRYIDPDDFVGKHVVVVDDVRITGSIERSITAMLADIDVRSITVANLVKLDPVVAAEQPQLEDQLNHFAIGGVGDLYKLMSQREYFTLTTRAVKYILQSSPDDLEWLLGRLDPNQLDELYEGVVDDGYDQMPEYNQAFRAISIASSLS